MKNLKTTRKSGFTLIQLLIAVSIISLVLVFIISMFGNSNTTKTQAEYDFTRMMKQERISNPVSSGYQFTGCAQDDIFRTGFTGVKNGQKVNGVLCSGFFKGTTVRYY